MSKIVDTPMIDCLLAIAQTGSFTKAANKLFISQPALSRKVMVLEKELGIELFERATSPVTLTYAGQHVLNRYLQIKGIDESIKREIFDYSEGSRGCIRFGLSHSSSRGILHLILPKFKNLYPNVEILLSERTSLDLEKLVFAGELDLAIVHYPRIPELEYLEITAVPLYIAVPKFYYEGRDLKFGTDNPPIDITEIQDQPFILLKSGQSLRSSIDVFFESKRVFPNVLIETESIEVANNLVKENMGFAFSLAPFLSKDGVYCPIKDYNDLRPIHICMQKNTLHTRSFNALLEIIKEAVLTYTQR